MRRVPPSVLAREELDVDLHLAAKVAWRQPCA